MTKDWSKVNREEESIENSRVLSGPMAEWYGIVQQLTHFHGEDLQAEHEILHGFRYLNSEGKTPVWLLFGIQLYLDMRHIMRDGVSKGLADLRRGAHSIRASINKVLNAHQEVQMHDPQRLRDKELRRLLVNISGQVDENYVADILDRAGRLYDPSQIAYIPPHFLLERDPLWCYLLLYSIKILAHRVAIQLVNDWSFTLVAAHLYNGIRQANLSSRRWEDMEQIISMHGSSVLFVGDRPTRLNRSYTRYALACGLPASMFARGSREHISRTPRVNRSRMLGELAPILSTFGERLCGPGGRRDLAPNEVSAILRKASLIRGETRSGCRFNMPRALVLDNLRYHVKEEMAWITFDHLAMHVICWKLVRELHQACATNDSGWRDLYLGELVLPSLILRLLRRAAEEEEVLETAGLESIPNDMLLADAAEILDDVIACEGDVAGRESRAM